MDTYMAPPFENYIKVITTVLLVGIVISVTGREFTAMVPEATAQATSVENMTAPMLDSVRFHLKSADQLLTNGDMISALTQINLAETQLALLNMGSQGTSICVKPEDGSKLHNWYAGNGSIYAVT